MHHKPTGKKKFPNNVLSSCYLDFNIVSYNFLYHYQVL